MLTLDELLADLPRGSADIASADVLPAGISAITDTDQRFVAPRLTPTDDSSDQPAIVLVSAPAAVGKSMLAREIARHLGALLWDVGDFAVGSGTFVGKLSEIHGPAELGAVVSAIGAGKYCAVIDALDEGYTRARSSSYEEFLRDLATQLMRLQPPRPAVIALGRAETTDLSELILRHEGIAVSHLSIEYFSDEEAREYIDRYLAAGGHTAHVAHREPFETARDRIFEQVGEAITPSEADELQRDAFLGYAPVLSALAGYLRQDNYVKLNEELKYTVSELTPGHPDSVWAFLKGLLEGLLDREQEKLRDRLDDALRTSIADHIELGRLYGATEQAERLIGRALDAPIAVPQLPAALAAEYEESVAGAIMEHPYVGSGDLGFASVVFRDYLLAWSVAVGPGDLADRVRARVRAADFRTSPLLGRFLCELLAQDGDVAINAEDLTLIYESLRSEDAPDRYTALMVGDTSDHVFAEINVAAGGHVSLRVDLSADAPVRFLRRLANANVLLASHSVELGQFGDQLLLGPAVHVDAGEVAVRASDVRIEARPNEPVLILAESFVGDAPDARVNSFGPDSLVIGVNHPLGYPWASYRVDVERLPNGEQLESALRELGRLMTWFKGDVSGRLSHPVKTMDTLVAKERVSPTLFRHALDVELIVRDGKDYVLRPDTFGINFQQVRLRQATDEVVEFLAPMLDGS